MHDGKVGDPENNESVSVSARTDHSALELAKKNVPQVIKDAGHPSAYAYEEFLFGQIRNPSTRRAHEAAVKRFLAWLETNQLPLVEVSPRDVGDYLDSLELSIPSKKLHRPP